MQMDVAAVSTISRCRRRATCLQPPAELVDGVELDALTTVPPGRAVGPPALDEPGHRAVTAEVAGGDLVHVADRPCSPARGPARLVVRRGVGEEAGVGVGAHV